MSSGTGTHQEWAVRLISCQLPADPIGSTLADRVRGHAGTDSFEHADAFEARDEWEFGARGVGAGDRDDVRGIDCAGSHSHIDLTFAQGLGPSDLSLSQHFAELPGSLCDDRLH